MTEALRGEGGREGIYAAMHLSESGMEGWHRDTNLEAQRAECLPGVLVGENPRSRTWLAVGAGSGRNLARQCTCGRGRRTHL